MKCKLFAKIILENIRMTFIHNNLWVGTAIYQQNFEMNKAYNLIVIRFILNFYVFLLRPVYYLNNVRLPV